MARHQYLHPRLASRMGFSASGSSSRLCRGEAARRRRRDEEGNLLREFCFGLLLRTTSGRGNGDVGSTVEDVLAVDGALAKRCPSFRVVVVHVGRIGRRSRDA